MEEIREIGPHRRVGDWSIWPLAEDRVVSESFGWFVVVCAPEHPARHEPRSSAIGGFTHTRQEATDEIRRTLDAYGFSGGREVQP